MLKSLRTFREFMDNLAIRDYWIMAWFMMYYACKVNKFGETSKELNMNTQTQW